MASAVAGDDPGKNISAQPSATISVSVVVSTLNRADELALTLAGLRDQTFAPIEVVVAHGPSSDATAEVLQSVANSVIVISSDETNTARLRNAAIDAAQGDVVAFLDDECVPFANWLAVHAAWYTDPEIAAVGGFVLDRQGTAYRSRHRVARRSGGGRFDVTPPVDGFLAPGADPHLLLASGNCSVRRSVLTSIGGWDDEAASFDDAALSKRLIDDGRRVIVDGASIVQYCGLEPHPLRVTRSAGATASDEWAKALTVEAENVLHRRSGGGRVARVRIGDLPHESTTHGTPRSSTSAGAIRVAIIDEPSDGGITTARHSTSATHVVWGTRTTQTVTPALANDGRLVWLHVVGVPERLLPGISDVATNRELIEEAALLHELRLLRTLLGDIDVTDERASRAWPLAELTATSNETLESAVSALIGTSVASGSAARTALVESLLDRTTFPIPVRERIARAMTEPPDRFLCAIFDAVVARMPTDEEIAIYEPLAASRTGRRQMLRNLVSSVDVADRQALVTLTGLVDELELDGLRAGVLDAISLPPDRCIDELYRVVLGRKPDSAGRATFTRQMRKGASRSDVAVLVLNSHESVIRHADILTGVGRLADSLATRS